MHRFSARCAQRMVVRAAAGVRYVAPAHSSLGSAVSAAYPWQQRRCCSTTAPGGGEDAAVGVKADCALDKELQQRLHKLIHADRVVVFLTGSPDQPRCRFTAMMVDMLRQLGFEYGFVNILEDDDVCEGLKVYSSWPTYPQMYVDGELVGGFDVTKEMVMNGELMKLLKEKKIV
jgi:monothiol glutaredoxin